MFSAANLGNYELVPPSRRWGMHLTNGWAADIYAPAVLNWFTGSDRKTRYYPHMQTCVMKPTGDYPKELRDQRSYFEREKEVHPMSASTVSSEPTTRLSQLDQLRRFTRIVADTSDFSAIQEFEPEDATTNPSLILKASQMPAYEELVTRTIRDRKSSHLAGSARITELMDDLLVAFGTKILEIVPGRVSTETDADLSFDKEGLIAKARHLISLYETRGVPRERVLIKIASTWEGVCAANVLQREKINCNMTLLFSLPQAVACADAGAKLISPFVGRILDWHQQKTGKDYAPADDPGVLSVKDIFHYFKKHEIPTEIMGASFRNTGEVLALAGCDLLTISPKLLRQLQDSYEPVERKLDAAESRHSGIRKMELDEKRFRWLLNEDAMATEKLAEGVRLFAEDARKLQHLVSERIA